MRSRRSPTTAREAAFAVLARAEAADAFVSVLLFHTLERSRLASADRALATAIVFGVLRHRARLDHALAPLLARPLGDLPAAIRTILRMGAAQLLVLERIPAAVAVSASVELARRHGHAGTARLVNAVLRRLAAEGPPAPPDRATDPLGFLAVQHSHPRWLLARWAARWGAGEAEALVAANNRPAPSTLRVNTLRASRDEVLAALRARGVEACAGRLPESVRVTGSLTDRLPVIDDGLAVVQDEAAMLVARAVAPPPGGVVIDACAAPGGKATHLAALMDDRGRLFVCDAHPRKLQALAHRAAALGVSCLEAHHLDARELGARWPDAADAVLVDAPCSGLGTVRRRPEIRWRAEEADLARHAAGQAAILAGAAGAVRPGGVLVYSVCSLEPEEGPEVVDAFLAAHPAFTRDPLPQGCPRDLDGSSITGDRPGEAWLLPHRHDTDGFYLARLRRG
ncbi:MAG: 16S rRNA (cytosine(967)-C(5))-methyltransferase RsmB [Armatimonadota bacterium]|nr:16S rRNA (cytosine(967)-C(5))-methyltransferase RsmB [Armatimonadota bacterium]MDR7453412.1 16S rRNA (cytosine(967)-C(5))-methyltransferase RsmB [Armatimonadota bacterium]MDR7456257.1 16S rRNA (cytosine(967)-C(5))-methyltransferase RsmB [Armatimonadota bacterium]MDR7497628.1 16S rRNA (cytosine(967)-C(5))-methyltransferase RsmB [Armatimonadota bacterium]MDR7512679.1 16S rRNA (cytosine(967)-C(5))-methyltransferase RsmB [Armatimonadota bacterium]